MFSFEISQNGDINCEEIKYNSTVNNLQRRWSSSVYLENSQNMVIFF